MKMIKLINSETGAEVVTTASGVKAHLANGYTLASDAKKSESKTPQWPSSHADLDTLAEKLGVTFPAPADGKKKLTTAEKIAAIETAGHTPESAAEAA